MALAHIKYEGSIDGHQQFQADIGTNRYFRVVVGDSQTFRSYGVPHLEKQKYTSPLYGPVPESKFGRVSFRIPNHLITRESRSVQLLSYKDDKENGLAVSEITRVIPSLSQDDLPTIQLSMEKPAINQSIVSVPFQYRETRISEGLFLDQLLKALPKVIPAVSGLFKKITATGGTKTTTGAKDALKDNLLDLMKDPAKLQQVISLLTGVQGAAPTTNPEVVTEPDASSEAAAFDPTVSSALIDPLTIMTIVNGVMSGLEKLGKIGAQINKDELDTLVKLNPGVADPDIQGLLNQMSAVPVSSALIDPLTIMTIVNGVMSGLEKLGAIGAQINKDELDTLVKLNPGVVDPDIQALLNQMSVSNYTTPRIDYKTSSAVRMEPDQLQTLSVDGEQRYVFAANQQLSFPIKLTTPRDIPGGIYQIIVRREKGGEVLVQTKQRHDGSTNSAMTIQPILPLHLADDLVAGEKYKVYIALLWRSKGDMKYGCSYELPISIANQSVFNRIGQIAEVVSLNDIEIHRPFWHKIWQADYTEDVKRYEFEAKYYYTIEQGRNANAQMETIEELTPARPHKMEGRMKSGLIMSADVLNKLLPTLATKQPYRSMSEDQLKALQTESFMVRQQRASRTGMKYQGKEGQMAALWVYPEMSIREVILDRVGGINAHGNVTSWTEESVYFPVPEAAHFIGTQSEQG